MTPTIERFTPSDIKLKGKTSEKQQNKQLLHTESTETEPHINLQHVVDDNSEDNGIFAANAAAVTDSQDERIETNTTKEQFAASSSVEENKVVMQERLNFKRQGVPMSIENVDDHDKNAKLILNAR